MPRLTRESNVNVGNKELKIEDLLKTIIYLPAPQVKSFFMEIGLTIPRELRIFVLRETLREKVIETRKSRLTLADELNYRLSWFTEFTETQLENLMIFFDDPKLNKDFLEDFWTDLIAYMVDKGVPPKDLKRILDMSIDYVKKVGLELPDIKTYNREIKDLFFDSFGRIDGSTPNKFRTVLYKSSTLGEVRDLGTKYDVDVPRRLKKSQLADIIIHELKERGQLTDELAQQVRSMSVLVMQRFAIDHDIKASTELKKEEIIEYILANAKETKEAYFIPDSKEVYERELEEVEAEVKVAPKVVVQPKVEEDVVEEKIEDTSEDIVEEAKIDDDIEEVVTKVEEKVVEPQPKVIYKEAAPSADVSELVEEIKKLRLAVEHIYEEQHLEHQAPIEKELEKQAPIILNSAEMYGSPKSLKKIIKDDEADERENFIESRKEKSSIGTNKEAQDMPAELKFFGKVFKGLGRFLWKILKFLLKIALIVAAIGIVLFVVYGTITAFWQPAFLTSINNSINSVTIAGKGILQHVHDIINSFRN